MMPATFYFTLPGSREDSFTLTASDIAPHLLHKYEFVPVRDKDPETIAYGLESVRVKLGGHITNESTYDKFLSIYPDLLLKVKLSDTNYRELIDYTDFVQSDCLYYEIINVESSTEIGLSGIHKYSLELMLQGDINKR